MKKYTVIAETGVIIAGAHYAKGDTVELASGAILEAALRFKQIEALEEKAPVEEKGKGRK